MQQNSMCNNINNSSYMDIPCINQGLTFNFTKKIFDNNKIEFNQKKLNFVDSNKLYTNLAYLFSDQNPYKIFVFVYSNNDLNDLTLRKEFVGPILKQIDEVFNFICLSNHIRSTYEGLIRIDKLDYDNEALFEALLNSMIHRDYSLNGNNLIHIHEDSIQFISIGGFVNGINKNQLLNNKSISRNFDLLNVLTLLKFANGKGYGIKKILDSYNDIKAKPIINTSENGFSLILPNRNKTI